MGIVQVRSSYGTTVIVVASSASIVCYTRISLLLLLQSKWLHHYCGVAALVQLMVYRLDRAKPLSEPVWNILVGPLGTKFSEM